MSEVSFGKDEGAEAWQKNRENVSTLQRVSEKHNGGRVEANLGPRSGAPGGTVDLAQEFIALLNGLVGDKSFATSSLASENLSLLSVPAKKQERSVELKREEEAHATRPAKRESTTSIAQGGGEKDTDQSAEANSESNSLRSESSSLFNGAEGAKPPSLPNNGEGGELDERATAEAVEGGAVQDLVSEGNQMGFASAEHALSEQRLESGQETEIAATDQPVDAALLAQLIASGSVRSERTELQVKSGDGSSAEGENAQPESGSRNTSLVEGETVVNNGQHQSAQGEVNLQSVGSRKSEDPGRGETVVRSVNLAPEDSSKSVSSGERAVVELGQEGAPSPVTKSRETLEAKSRQTIGQFDTVLPQGSGEFETVLPKSLNGSPSSAQSLLAQNPVAQNQMAQTQMAQSQIAQNQGGARESSASQRIIIPGAERSVKGGALPFDVGSRQLGAQPSAPREFSLAQKLPPGMQTKIVNQIQKLLDVTKPTGNQMVVRLDPPELGAVTVRLTVRGEQMFARIVPENREVETVLRDRAQEIVQVISGGGIKAENIHVTIGREPQEFGYFFEDRGGASRGDRHFEEQLSPRHSEQDWRGSQEVPEESKQGAPGWVA